MKLPADRTRALLDAVLPEDLRAGVNLSTRGAVIVSLPGRHLKRLREVVTVAHAMGLRVATDAPETAFLGRLLAVLTCLR